MRPYNPSVEYIPLTRFSNNLSQAISNTLHDVKVSVITEHNELTSELNPTDNA